MEIDTTCGPRERLVAAGLCLTILAPIAVAAPVVLQPGYSINLESDALSSLTQITFGPDDRLYAGSLSGDIYAFDYDANGIASAPILIAENVGSLLLGIGFDAQGDLYASSNEGANNTGFLARLIDNNGNGYYETHQHFVTALPNVGHHNDQLAIDGRLLYVAMGSRTDDGEADDVMPIAAATMLRVDLDTVNFGVTNNLPGVYAYGLRNAFGITLDEGGRLWAGDNGRDTPLLQDSLHFVKPGRHHGFPSELAPPDAVAPILTLGLGTSADGCDFYPTGGPWGPNYADDLFITRFDFELDNPAGVGMDVVRIVIDRTDPNNPTGIDTVFANGFFHPLDAEVDPFGNLLVMEHETGRIYRIVNGAMLAGDTDGDCQVNITDLGIVLSQFGMTGPGLAGDVNDDGVVNIADLGIVLANFGNVCP